MWVLPGLWGMDGWGRKQSVKYITKIWNDFISCIPSTNDYLVFSRKLRNNFVDSTNNHSIPILENSERLYRSQEWWWSYRVCTTYNQCIFRLDFGAPRGASKWDGSFQTGFRISRNRSRFKTLRCTVPLWELPYTVLSAHTAARQTIGPRLGWQNKKLLARALDWCRLARSLCPAERAGILVHLTAMKNCKGRSPTRHKSVYWSRRLRWLLLHDWGLPTLVDNNYR